MDQILWIMSQTALASLSCRYHMICPSKGKADNPYTLEVLKDLSGEEAKVIRQNCSRHHSLELSLDSGHCDIPSHGAKSHSPLPWALDLSCAARPLGASTTLCAFLPDLYFLLFTDSTIISPRLCPIETLPGISASWELEEAFNVCNPPQLEL